MNKIYRILKTLIVCATLALVAPVGMAEADKQRVSVNINTASAQMLAETLDGVGLKKAEAIVAWRKQNGAFPSADALAVVKGIGESTVERNRRRIRIR